MFTRLKAAYKDQPSVIWLRLIYIAALLYVFIFLRAMWTPDMLFVMFLLLFSLFGKGREFFLNFGPFALLLLTYDSFRGLAPFLNSHVHFTEMIDFDRFIGFGQLPTERLQHLLYHGSIQWYDYAFYLVYMLHFVMPWIGAILIWRFRKRLYSRFVVSFLLLSYAGFITYVLFPAAPPWMASEMGLIPPLHKVSTDVWWSLGVHNFSEVYKQISPNLVAAVPSLHAAYAMLIYLWVRRAFGWRWSLAIIWYPLMMWVGIIYMGEHYVADALLGIIYAALSYWFTEFLYHRYGPRLVRVRNRAYDRAKRLAKRGQTVTPLNRLK